MILWPTVAPALLPSRCGRSDGAQDMAFAEVFALCAGVPLSGDETSPEAKIAELEARLGVRLLNRTTRAVSVTEPGQRFLAGARRVWPFVVGAGLASIVFGVLFGEFFGPTGVLPVIWLAPLEHPVPLLLAAVAAGIATKHLRSARRGRGSTCCPTRTSALSCPKQAAATPGR